MGCQALKIDIFPLIRQERKVFFLISEQKALRKIELAEEITMKFNLKNFVKFIREENQRTTEDNGNMVEVFKTQVSKKH